MSGVVTTGSRLQQKVDSHFNLVVVRVVGGFIDYNGHVEVVPYRYYESNGWQLASLQTITVDPREISSEYLVWENDSWVAVTAIQEYTPVVAAAQPAVAGRWTCADLRVGDKVKFYEGDHGLVAHRIYTVLNVNSDERIGLEHQPTGVTKYTSWRTLAGSRFQAKLVVAGNNWQTIEASLQDLPTAEPTQEVPLESLFGGRPVMARGATSRQQASRNPWQRSHAQRQERRRATAPTPTPPAPPPPPVDDVPDIVPPRVRRRIG